MRNLSEICIGVTGRRGYNKSYCKYKLNQTFQIVRQFRSLAFCCDLSGL